MFLSLKDLTKRYGVTLPTIRVWIRKGLLPQGLRFGKIRRFPLSDVEAFERKNKIATTGHE